MKEQIRFKQHVVNEGKIRNAIMAGMMSAASLFGSNKMSYPQTKQLISYHEGKKNIVYSDSKGYNTIGIGFNLDSNPQLSKAIMKYMGVDYDKVMAGEVRLTDSQVDILFRYTVHQAAKDAAAAVNNFKDLPPEAQMALTDMSFNMGLTKLLGFKNMIAAIERYDFHTAAREAVTTNGKPSKWAQDVGPRRYKNIYKLFMIADQKMAKRTVAKK